MSRIRLHPRILVIALLAVVVSLVQQDSALANCESIYSYHTTCRVRIENHDGSSYIVVVGECIEDCDGSVSCWGDTTPGLARCSTTTHYCGEICDEA